MNFKTGLIKKKTGQASIEYIVLAAVILSLMLLSVNRFFPDIKKNLDEKFFKRSVERIVAE